ncbi:MAG: hypothetical protein Q7U98_06890 [Methylicorpusculum sp.]|uniref:hypothetical protein n=1 Tax=Methylicorpusculum sp. TaxID=2713644 RepID=UPI0027217908|nr:hypothetical protein [Methylicorpusculum sp.]MDO8938868.1 hypothetical protein [Methylicorpusculum sp.]MDP2201567.1 hypothetical protein [Methylicorpusculum sp.]
MWRSKFRFLHYLVMGVVVLGGCTTSRQLALDYPVPKASSLAPSEGISSEDGDDYYVQLMSEFELKGDNALKAGCTDIGPSYETNETSAAVIFKVKNEAVNFQQDVTALVYKAGTGKCNFNLETRKAALTPWLRLDLSKETAIDYSFVTSNQSDTNVTKLLGDVNTTTNLLAITGVGLGVAVMGKMANEWVQSAPVFGAQVPVPAQTVPSAAKVSSETHNLQSLVRLSGKEVILNETRLPVYEVADGATKILSSEPKLLGELKVYPELRRTLLLKNPSLNVPNAQDLSLDELWRSPIRTAKGSIDLKTLIDKVDSADKPNLQPDWKNYAEVESQCRKLKRVLRELGFNKYDRNAVLFYFLGSSTEWQNYTIPAAKLSAGDYKISTLQQYRERNFSGCLAKQDYDAMAQMGLPVNTDKTWETLLMGRRKQESVVGPVQSIGRQLTAVINNKNPTEMARQIYPLIATAKEGNGQVLLQNNLGDFGLENLLGVTAISGEGVVLSYQQVEQVFNWLAIKELSCSRPAIEQGKPLGHIGLMLFTTQDGSPWPKGGALEYEILNGKIARLSFQNPAFRDFEQSLIDFPEVGGCRISSDFVQKLK